MAIYHNLIVKNNLDELVDTRQNIEPVVQQNIGVMVLINDVSKKANIFTLFEDIISAKICLNSDKYFLLLKGDHSMYQYIKQKCNSIVKAGGVSIGISTVSESIKDIPKIFKEAEISVYSSFFSNKNNVFVYHKTKDSYIENAVSMISEGIDNKDFEQIIQLLKNVPDIFASRNLNLECIEVLWNQVVALILNKIKKEFSDKEFEFMSYLDIINKFGNIFELCQYLINFFSSLDSSVNNIKLIKNNNENFNRLLEFVNKHYNEDLHLKELASKYFINTTYCCELFRKVTGITYSEYVTSLRMEKACEFLEKDDGLTISEICNKVGYNDYYYFNRIFKKIYGITPLGYRKKGIKMHP